MTVRNVRTRNWSASSSNSHRVVRGRRWIVILIAATSLFLFILVLISQSNRDGPIQVVEFPGQKYHEGDASLRTSSEHKLRRWSSSSSISLHRWYASSRNRHRYPSEEHVPLNAILYTTYQQEQEELKRNQEHEVPSPQHRVAMLLPYTATPSNPHNNNFVSILSYFSLFCYSVAGTADIMDFYIFHTGIIRHDSSSNVEDFDDVLRNHTTLQHCPPNVIFVNVQDHRGLAQYLLRVVDVKYDGNQSTASAVAAATTALPTKPPVMKYNELLDLIESYIKMNPYGLVEFKPALGHIFSDYINANQTIATTTKYTHWGYTDFDIVFGDISRWLTPEELNEYDIVTYTFGDQQRLYVRGQFTIHKNEPTTINQLWRQCSYLSDLDERFDSIVQHTTKYHVESAEGCYSAVLLNQTNISIKFAVKAWTDIYTDDTAFTHGVAISQSPISGRQVLYKLKNDFDSTAGTSSTQLFYQLRSSWFENEDSTYNDRSVDLQRPIGERIRLDDPYDNDDAAVSATKSSKKKPCMYWALAKYQSKLCLKDGIVNSNDIVYFINGVLYKQQFENIAIFPNENNHVITAPLFHFQEWKRSYRYEQVAPIYSSLLSSSSSIFHTNNGINTFLLTKGGVIPMISSHYEPSPTKRDEKKQSSKGTVSSPLSLTDMKMWSSAKHLPLANYCIRSRLDGSKLRTKCDTAISYHDDTGRLTILSHAPEWKSLNVDADVTLVLTLQILASWNIDTNERLVQSVIGNAIMNIDRWYGQPCILVISIPTNLSRKTTEYIRQQLDIETNPNFNSCFILTISHDLIQEENDADTISRKALLNMAIDMVPTRWYISGIELERGLLLSMDTSYIAHRTAETHSTLRGNIFLIPQFGIIDKMTGNDGENEKEIDHVEESKLTFDELIRLKRSGNVKPVDEEWDLDCSEQEDVFNDLTKRLDNIWMAESLLLTGSLTSDVDPTEVNAKRIQDIETLQQFMMQMALGGMDEDYEDTAMYQYNESPIILTDNIGPYDGVRTSEMVREVEAFAGIRCYNGVRLSQMILMNYTLNVLPLAFVSKSSYAKITYSEMQKQQQHRNLKRCPAMCTNFLDDDEHVVSVIAQNEIQRAAMTAVVWAETIGIKPSTIADAE